MATRSKSYQYAKMTNPFLLGPLAVLENAEKQVINPLYLTNTFQADAQRSTRELFLRQWNMSVVAAVLEGATCCCFL